MLDQESQPGLARASAIDTDKPAFRIALKFGGLSGLAKAMGKAPSTCHRWMVSGFIPAKHQAEVLELARARRIQLRPADFIAS